MGDGTRLYILAPIVRGRKGEYRKDLADLQKSGFQRVKVDSTLYEIDEVPALNKKLKHDIEVVVDRVVVREGLESRLADSLETALGLTDGIAFAENADQDGTGGQTVFSAKFACPVSGFTIDEIEPGCSPSTTLSAPARRATASACACTSTTTWWCPTKP